MEKVYSLLASLLVLCVWTEFKPVKSYLWSCSRPDDAGYRHIPSIGYQDWDASTVATVGEQLNIYHLPDFDHDDCYDNGRVIAIEYCYQFDNTTVGSAIFNWTVLILEENSNGNYSIRDAITIVSCDLDEADCIPDKAGQLQCCDVTEVPEFDHDLPFIFGVTESAQGNTHNATLLGYNYSESDYLVDTIRLNKSGLSLTINSTVPSTPDAEIQDGLRILWFIIESTEDDETSTSSKRRRRSMSSQPNCNKLTKPLSLTEPMITNDEISEMDSSALLLSPIGEVIGGLLSLCLILVIVIIVLSLVVVKRRQSEKCSGNISGNDIKGYHNAVYNAAPAVPLRSGNLNSMSDAHYEFVNSELGLGHDYSLPDETQNLRIVINNTAKTIISAESGYEVPQETLSGVHNEDTYMVPASDEYSLYSQLSQNRIYTFTRNALKLTAVLGSGQFGTVHKGEWVAAEGREKIEVAVKTLKEGASEQDKVKFLQEAAIMGQFSHPNLVKLYGVVTEGEPIMLIIELLSRGDLRGLLCSAHSKSDSVPEIDADLPHNLLSYCRQVASGMGYLAGKCFVHRDLAARNILVSEDDVCKIADFGMSRDLADADYYVSHGGMIPVKWTAPEAIHYKKYSTASDVWSFGCVMYEIWSLGHKPFEVCTNVDCIKVVDKGIRLAPPPGCPRIIYKLMIDCWHPDPSSRPDFVSVVQQLSLPDTKLLKWREEDKATDPEAATLGAGLDKAVDLYKDLQQQYTN